VERLARGSVQWRNLKVLVVDEHYPSVAVLCHALTSHAYICIGVTSAAAALDVILSFRPDAVVYEWNLRDGKGIGLAKRLRDLSPQEIMLIALSALDEPENFCANEQVDAYVTKPFDLAQLESMFARGVRGQANRTTA
jgi:DNA-binding response OmpR family regulator